MKTLLTFLTLAALYLLPGMTPANAHAIWIESNAKATKNKAHELKIFYGEYPEGEIEATEKWFSDLNTLEVWVTSPTQKKTRLTLTNAATHLVGSFTPTEDGMYYLSTVHATKDLGGTTKYEFSSVVPVLAGNVAPAVTAPTVPLAIVTQPKAYKTNDVVEVQVWKNGKAFKDGKVELMSPEGWVKTMKTDASGKVVFTPKLKGSYVLETSDYKEENGEWNKKSYTHSWQGATTRILVN